LRDWKRRTSFETKRRKWRIGDVEGGSRVRWWWRQEAEEVSFEEARIEALRRLEGKGILGWGGRCLQEGREIRINVSDIPLPRSLRKDERGIVEDSLPVVTAEGIGSPWNPSQSNFLGSANPISASSAIASQAELSPDVAKLAFDSCLSRSLEP
jgi:hypothetical protein